MCLKFFINYIQLGQGVLVKVSPSLIKRCKNHFHNLPCGVTVILGNNGYIWVCPLQATEGAEGGFIQQLDVSNNCTRPSDTLMCALHLLEL